MPVPLPLPVPLFQEGSKHVKPLKYYTAAAAKMKHKCTAAELVLGGNGQLGNQSLAYACHVRHVLQAAGFQVGMRVNALPDDDFVYMSRAQYFLPSGGGFSNVIQRVNLYMKRQQTA